MSDESSSEPTATDDLAGLSVLHLFFRAGPTTVRDDVELAIKEARSHECQVVVASLLGHKADVAVVGIGATFDELRILQSHLVRAGLELVDSYVSLTELSEYAEGVPEAQRMARLRPVLPPQGMEAFCFYPMSKRRDGPDNWFRLGFDERRRLMQLHGATGRTFRGRVLQLVTGSTGLDDYEWGVTLFATTLEDIKDCVYTMRFDEASSRFAEFGTFYVGTLGEPDAVLAAAGVET